MPHVEIHKEFAELLSAGLLKGDTDGPYTAEDSEIGENFFDFLGNFCFFFVILLEVSG